MAIVLEAGMTLSLEDRLTLRGIQTDEHGEVMGGHRIVVDFSTLFDEIASGSEVENLVYGSENATTTIALSGITAANGITFPTSGMRRIYMGDGMKPSDMGAAPSFAVSMWLTRDGSISQNYAGIAGCIDANNSAETEWRWLLNGDSSGIIIAVNDDDSSGAEVIVDLPPDTATLVTMVVKATSSTTYIMKVYVGDDFVASASGTYGAFAATEGASLGSVAGGSGAFQGVFHRFQCFQFAPDVFDVDGWLANEVSANAVRF